MAEKIELDDCLASLKAILEPLDRIGAGIAAIHVDAAIQQLRTNIEAIAKANSCKDNPSLVLACEFPQLE